MAIIAKDEGKVFEQHPAGVWRMVCGDVHDEGIRAGAFGPKHQVRIVFVSELINENDPEKKPFEHSVWYTLSLNEKSNLRKFLEQWRGKAFTNKQIEEGWDVEMVKGAQAYVQIIQKPKKDGSGLRSEIVSIMKLPPTMQGLEIPKGFKSIKERLAEKEAANPQQPPKPQGRPFPVAGAAAVPSDDTWDDFHRDDDDDTGDDLPFSQGRAARPRQIAAYSLPDAERAESGMDTDAWPHEAR